MHGWMVYVIVFVCVCIKSILGISNWYSCTSNRSVECIMQFRDDLF